MYMGVSSTTIGFPTQNDHFEVRNGGTTILGNTHIYIYIYIDVKTMVLLCLKQFQHRYKPMVLKAKGLSLQNLAKDCDCSDLGYEVTPENWWFNSGLGIIIHSPKLTLSLKIDGWNTNVSFWGQKVFFQGRTCCYFLGGVDLKKLCFSNMARFQVSISLSKVFSPSIPGPTE